jgi:hypothetical protein
LYRINISAATSRVRIKNQMLIVQNQHLCGNVSGMNQR